ncbi:MAG: tyrosine-type recombinase/integrase [Polyangiaceae bacterium]
MGARTKGLDGLPIHARKGRWICYVRLPDGSRRERALHLRADGSKESERLAKVSYWQEQARATAGDGGRKRTPAKTLITALQALRAEQELAELGPDALNKTYFLGRNLMAYFGPDYDLHALTSAEQLVQYASQARKARSGATVRMELGVLGGAMRAVGLSRPPAPKLNAKSKPQEPLTEEEQRRLLLAATPRHKLTILLLLTLGPRRGEIARCGDVDWEAQTMRIAGTKTEKSDRVVPIPPDLLDHMLQLRAAGKWEGFPQVSAARIGKLVRDTCKRAGISRRSPNDLRGTASRRMRQSGVDAEIRAAIQGNSARLQEETYTRTHTMVDVMRAGLNATKRLTPSVKCPSGEAGTAANPSPVDTQDNVKTLRKS